MLSFQKINLSKSVLGSLEHFVGEKIAFVQPDSLIGTVIRFLLLILT